MADLTQDEWVEQLNGADDAVILDIRTTEEVEAGHIPNSVQLDIYKGQEFLDALEDMDKSKSYFVYCRSGARSAQACKLMEQIGFDKTYNLLGGILEWRGEIEVE